MVSADIQYYAASILSLVALWYANIRQVLRTIDFFRQTYRRIVL